MLDVAVLQLLRLLFSLIALLKIYGTLYNLQVAFFLSRRCYLAAETESKYKRLTAMTQGGAPYVFTRAKYKGVSVFRRFSADEQFLESVRKSAPFVPLKHFGVTRGPRSASY